MMILAVVVFLKNNKIIGFIVNNFYLIIKRLPSSKQHIDPTFR